MMKSLLEQYFGRHYNSPMNVEAVSVKRKGSFTFNDPKACGRCKIEKSCDNVVLKCDSSDQEIEAIYLEAFIAGFDHLRAIPCKKKCDLLLFDEDKIVFCDMTCSRAKYIDPFFNQNGSYKMGKRNTAREQISNSIALMSDVPEIATAINSKAKKIALFAYRVNDSTLNDDFDAKVRNGIRSFGLNTQNIIKEPLYSDMNNGFKFVEVMFPSTYLW